ncbi:Xylanolytic transcriptional activator xlnR [Cercospora zeina]
MRSTSNSTRNVHPTTHFRPFSTALPRVLVPAEPAIAAPWLVFAAMASSHASGRSCQFVRVVKPRGPKPKRRGYSATRERRQTTDHEHAEPSVLREHRVSDVTLPTTPCSTHSESHRRRPRQERETSGTDNVRQPYTGLAAVEHIIEDIVDYDVATKLFEHYFVQPNTASPFVLTPVIRQQSVLDPQNPRTTSPALTLTILWMCSLTAQTPTLFMPHQRRAVQQRLGNLAQAHVDEYIRQRTNGARSIDRSPSASVTAAREPSSQRAQQPEEREGIDDFLALLLLTIFRTSEDSKHDCPRMWQEVVEDARKLELHLLDEAALNAASPDLFPSQGNLTIRDLEAKEECRRTFWMLFALDRHWALCYNKMPLILEQDCQVYNPLPDAVWQDDYLPSDTLLHRRHPGPNCRIHGRGLFEWFLPLMTVLGDIIWLHHQRMHPRMSLLINNGETSRIDEALAKLEADILDVPWHRGQRLPQDADASTSAIQLYCQFLIHVLYILLHGRWDALDMLVPPSAAEAPVAAVSIDDPCQMALSDWVTSDHFSTCGSHAIAAAETISQILNVDPELAYMPYLFGIYLLQGSFILLFFASRMPEVGERPNESVGHACETIIRAHEICFATLNVDYQRNFRKVMRGVLHDARQGLGYAQLLLHDANGNVNAMDASPRSATEMQNESPATHRNSARLQGNYEHLISVLSVYRWTKGYSGLAV